MVSEVRDSVLNQGKQGEGIKVASCYETQKGSKKPSLEVPVSLSRGGDDVWVVLKDPHSCL